MLSANQAGSYVEKINRVRDYISHNLTDNLSVDKLSQVANFSKYHFHRQFSAHTGMNVGRYILLMRLKRASYQLVFSKHRRIIDIALDANFENPESFSRAFKNAFQQTPSQFRRNPQWEFWNQQFSLPVIERRSQLNVTIVDFDEMNVAVLEHRGTPDLLNDSISEFIQWRIQSQLSPVSSSKTIGVAYDDPETTEADKFRFDICGEVNSNVPENSQGVVNKVIPAGRCALLRHHGPYEEINQKVHYLYTQWLPEAGEELRDFPCYFHYVNLFPEVPEHELITDIYLPLR